MERPTWEAIQAANATIKLTDVKGKDYAEVSQRIQAFRRVYPDGFILPRMVSNENGLCVFRTEVGYYTPDMQPVVLGAGTAYEKEGSTYINKTSYIENCETSSVGRALGMAGFGNTSVASADEVQRAISAQVMQETAQIYPAPPVQENAQPMTESEFRARVLAKYGQEQMDRKCMGKWGVPFAEAPYNELYELLHKMI